MEVMFGYLLLKEMLWLLKSFLNAFEEKIVLDNNKFVLAISNLGKQKR